MGQAESEQLGSTAKLDAEKLFSGDPELDSPDLPTVADFLKAEGISEFFSSSP